MRAPFRVRKPKTMGAGVAPGAVPPTQTGDQWLARLVKLVPSEVIAIYLAGLPLAKSWPGSWAFVCLVLVVIVRTLGTREQGKPIQWIGVGVSCISFVIWIYATDGHFFALFIPDNGKGAPSIAVLVWTFVVPYFYKGD